MYHAVEGLGAAVVQYAYETLASPKHALERMLLQEVATQPDQSRRGAVVRAVGATGQSQTSVTGWAEFRISGALWKSLHKHSRDFEALPHRNQAPEGIASAVPAQGHATFDRRSWPAGLESILVVGKPPALHQITLPAQPQPSSHQPPDPILRPSSLPAQKQTPSQNEQRRYPGDTPRSTKRAAASPRAIR